MEESTIYSGMGRLVRQCRERLKMTQEDLARRIDLSRASVANIETGRQHIPVHHLYRLALALEVDVPALLPNLTPAAVTNRKIKSSMGLSDTQRADVAKAIGLVGKVIKREPQ